MGHDVVLADRVRDVLRTEPDVTERRMFGGLAFLAGGHLAVSVSGDGGLLVRVHPTDVASLLVQPSVVRFCMRDREVDGWLHVGASAVADDDALRCWLARGLTAGRALPGR